MQNKNLKKRILEISYKNKLSHIASCLEAVDIIEDVYKEKRLLDRFILSQGHAGLALYAVLESHGIIEDAEEFYLKSGTHPDRPNTMILNEYGDMVSPIDCSTGSLGHGLGIGLGMAIADSTHNVYVLTSDGELQEGSCYEALRIANDLRLDNFIVDVNCNELGAYKKIEKKKIAKLVSNFDQIAIKVWHTDVDYLPFLKGLEGHYHIMSDKDYKLALGVLG